MYDRKENKIERAGEKRSAIRTLQTVDHLSCFYIFGALNSDDITPFQKVINLYGTSVRESLGET